MTIRHTLSALGALAATLVFMADASAATIRVTCEVRAGRSTISVDGKGLPAGGYTTQALSGSNIASSPVTVAVAGQVETDYASNPGDIAEGATPISSSFIVGGQVTGKVLNGSGATVISDTVVCRVKR